MPDTDLTFHWAEEYLQRGYSIIPLVGKVPLPGFRWKEFQQRHPTLSELKEWFGGDHRSRPNIGIVTGRMSDLVVVDADSEEDLAWWLATHRSTPLVAVTGRGGAHLYYRAQPSARVGNRAGVFGRAIDIRGEGGYVVAPPSIHPITGRNYEWKSSADYSLDEVPLFDPAWIERPASHPLRTRLAGRRHSEIRSGPAYISRIKAISGQGGHNATFRATCSLRDAGLTPDEALQILLAWNQTNCEPRWSVQELAHKVRDAFMQGGLEPAV